MSLHNVCAVLPFSHKSRSSLSWRTICGPWCRWLRSSGYRNVWSDPPAAGFLTGPLGQSWSGRETVPEEKRKRDVIHLNLNLKQLHTEFHWWTPAYLPRHNLLIDLYRLICKEWRVASSHFIYEDSEGPPVHSFVITLSKWHKRVK